MKLTYDLNSSNICVNYCCIKISSFGIRNECYSYIESSYSALSDIVLILSTTSSDTKETTYLYTIKSSISVGTLFKYFYIKATLAYNKNKRLYTANGIETRK